MHFLKTQVTGASPKVTNNDQTSVCLKFSFIAFYKNTEIKELGEMHTTKTQSYKPKSSC